MVVAETAPQPTEWWAIALLCQNASAHSCCRYGTIIVSQPLIAGSMELDTILTEKKVCTQKKMVEMKQTQFKEQIKTWESPFQIFMSIKFYFCDCFEFSFTSRGGQIQIPSLLIPTRISGSFITTSIVYISNQKLESTSIHYELYCRKILHSLRPIHYLAYESRLFVQIKSASCYILQPASLVMFINFLH